MNISGATKSGINNRDEPWTVNCGFEDNELITNPRITNEMRKKIFRWIKACLKPRKTPLSGWSSYGIKHILEYDTGIYLTNNQFKHAMIICGYRPVDETGLNWNYRLSKKSPAFVRPSSERKNLLAEVSGE